MVGQLLKRRFSSNGKGKLVAKKQSILIWVTHAYKIVFPVLCLGHRLPNKLAGESGLKD